jgi:hypothetical protein
MLRDRQAQPTKVLLIKKKIPRKRREFSKVQG